MKIILILSLFLSLISNNLFYSQNYIIKFSLDNTDCKFNSEIKQKSIYKENILIDSDQIKDCQNYLTIPKYNGEYKLKIEIIGTRHGEKLYESLLTREEFVTSEDLGSYYRIKADNRDLNYGKYFELGDKTFEESEEYHSHNTYRLNKIELKEILLKLDYINKSISTI